MRQIVRLHFSGEWLVDVGRYKPVAIPDTDDLLDFRRFCRHCAEQVFWLPPLLSDAEWQLAIADAIEDADVFLTAEAAAEASEGRHVS